MIDSAVSSARKDLLDWLNSVGIPAKNLTSEYLANCSHTHQIVGETASSCANWSMCLKLEPSSQTRLPYTFIGFTIIDLQDDALANLELGIDAALNECGIPKLMEPEEMNSPNSDELANMTYLSYFRDKVFH